MNKFEIIEAKPYHVGQILHRLRKEHRAALDATSVNAHRELRSVFDKSSFRRAWFCDGELFAVGGVTGTLLSGSGFIWLAMAEKASRFPVAIVREARKQLAEIVQTRTELITTILCADPTSRRFAWSLGFVDSDIATTDNNFTALQYFRDGIQ